MLLIFSALVGINIYFILYILIGFMSRPSQWPRGLRRRSVAARLLRLWVRLPSEAWVSVCCECCVLSGRGLCDELITCPEEYYWLWCVVVCDLETSWMRRPWPNGGLSRHKQTKKLKFPGILFLRKALLVLLHLKVTDVRHKCRSWDNYWRRSLKSVEW